MRIPLRGAFVATAAVIAFLVAMPVAGSPPASKGSIVFVSNRGGETSLWVIGSNGAGRRRLTSGPGLDLAPVWSPGRRMVAFTSTRLTGSVNQQDVFVVRSDGSGLRAVVRSPQAEEGVSWSPDGRSLVFGRDTGGRGQWDLFVVRVSTGRVRRLTATKAAEGAPAWSPNGRWIAYARDAAIWLIRPDGTGAHGLGRTGAGVDWGPDWSPDGRRIAYQSNSRTSNVNSVEQVWIMCADGSGKRRLTAYNRRRPIIATGPAFSPGGALIAFTRGDQISTMRPDGSRVRQVTRAPGHAFGADW